MVIDIVKVLSGSAKPNDGWLRVQLRVITENI